jgi:hypothetical protein
MSSELVLCKQTNKQITAATPIQLNPTASGQLQSQHKYRTAAAIRQNRPRE